MPSKENMAIQNEKPEIGLCFEKKRYNQRETAGIEHYDARDSTVNLISCF